MSTKDSVAGINVNICFLLLGLLISLIPGPALSAEPAGRLIHARGEVMHSLDGGKTWEPSKVPADFPEGTLVRVGPRGDAALLLPDHSQIRLQAGSILRLKKAGSAPGETAKKQGVLDFIKGKLWFRNKRRGPKPLFETPTVTIAIRGTEIALDVDDPGDTNVTVLEGSLKCENPYGEAIIARGQAVSATRGRPPEIVKLLVPEDSVQWLLLTPEIRGPGDREIPSIKSREGVELAENAMTLFTEGNRARALETAKRAVDKAGERAAPHVALATVLQSAGRLEEALIPALKGAELDPASVPAAVRAVELLMGLGRSEEAKKLLGKFPDGVAPRILLLKGYLALSDLHTEKAAKLFENAVASRGDLSPAYLGLGLALFRMGKPDDALLAMEKAALLTPLAAYPHYYLAKALYERGEREEAQVELRRAAILDPLDPTPHQYLSVMLADAYRPGEGILELQKALEKNDNRLATRGRYLLDTDRAAKNVSLAYSLSFMGLNHWAKSRGDRAVWNDPTDSGAYLFRARQSVSQNSIDPATLGDIARARLLQPVNRNTFDTYSDYQSFLEMPETEATFSLIGGSDDTFRSALGISGGRERIAYYGEGDISLDNGPFGGTGIDTGKVLTRVKGVLKPGHELFLEYNFNDTDEEDRRPWQDGSIAPLDRSIETEFHAASLGYHLDHGPGRDLMALFQARKRDRDDSLESTFQAFFGGRNIDIHQRLENNLSRDTLRLEVVELFRAGSHRFSLGAALLGSDNDRVLKQDLSVDEPGLSVPPPQRFERDHETFEAGFYAGDTWFVTPAFSIDFGFGVNRLDDVWLDASGDREDKENLLPYLGLVYRKGKRDLFRLALFSESEPDVQSGTLRASEVAGFEKATGAPYGTRTDFMGLGWDRQWSPMTFTRFELFYREREYPSTFSPHPLVPGWRDEDTTGGSLAFERLLTERWALALEFNVRDIRAGEPVKKRRDLEAICRLTWVHPAGWRSQAALWYLDQDEKRGYEGEVDDDFIIASISVEKSFMNRRGLLFARLENVFGESYGHLTVDAVQSTQLPRQDTLAVLGIQWNF